MRNERRGFTLLELIVTVTMVGILAAVATARLSSSTQANHSTVGDARRLALDLLQAQRRAISTGDNHYVAFTTTAGKIVSYTLYRRQSGVNVAVDAVHTFDTQITITSADTNLEYQPLYPFGPLLRQPPLPPALHPRSRKASAEILPRSRRPQAGAADVRALSTAGSGITQAARDPGYCSGRKSPRGPGVMCRSCAGCKVSI